MGDNASKKGKAVRLEERKLLKQKIQDLEKRLAKKREEILSLKKELGFSGGKFEEE